MNDIQFDICSEVCREVARAHAKHGKNSMLLPAVPHLLRNAILVEETGEVSKALIEGDPAELRTELVQVAAVAIGWLQVINGELGHVNKRSVKEHKQALQTAFVCGFKASEAGNNIEAALAKFEEYFKTDACPQIR